MKNRAISATDPRFRGTLGSGKWTLCVGAGISRGIVPTWLDLTRRVVNKAFATTFDPKTFQEFVASASFGLDAWIQAAANKHLAEGKPLESFDDLLEETLYSDLLNAPGLSASRHDLIQLLHDPRKVTGKRLLRLCEYFDASFADTSLLAVARFLVSAELAARLPVAILTFNADMLLVAFVEALRARRAVTEGVALSPPRLFKPVLRGLNSALRTLPVYHCHGALLPDLPTGARTGQRGSRDKLVFREGEYLETATAAATWAESVFVFHAGSSHVLFVGHSLSDPNIRRWLSVVASTTISEMKAFTGRANESPQHLWLTKRPSTSSDELLFEFALLHLGVRVAWIDEWSEVGPALSNLLAV